MGRWRGAWVMGVCLALVGCGSSSPAPSPEETPPENERSGPPSVPDPGGPSKGPDEGNPSEGEPPPANSGTPSPLESTAPSLPARACILRTDPKPPVRATACASNTVFADGTTQRARYDADSHPLEVRTFTASGALSKVETQVWRDGLQRLQRAERPDGSFDQTEWTYDEQSRLKRRVSTSKTYTSSFDFSYDALGRISRVDRHTPYEDITSLYTYDASGRLVSIENDGDCGYDETRCSTLTYWPNGRVKQDKWERGRAFIWDDYNELGQLIFSKVIDDQAYTESTRAYDSEGRLVRLRESYKGSGGRLDTFIETLTTTVNDPAGWRERLARDNREVCIEAGCDPNRGKDEWTTYTRVTHRTTFLCGTQIVALDEWDSNEDGVVDARRTHERDEEGRLVREAYSGTPGLDKGPVSRDFQYDCP